MRAWLTLLKFCFLRHARVRQMVWIAFGLMAMMTLATVVASRVYGWDLKDRRPRFRRPTYAQTLTSANAATMFPGFAPGVTAHRDAVTAAVGRVLDRAEFANFSRWMIFQVYLGYLMPLWSLAFATASVGQEREGHTLIWLLSRPLPRWSIYVAKLLSVMPWVLGFNLGGMAAVCSAAGEPGVRALHLYWPAVAAGTLAYVSLFHFMGAAFRRPAVIGLLYAFFIENFVSDLPGTWKRISINFYSRCVVYDRADEEGWVLTNPLVFSPVEPATAWWALGAITAALGVLGMVWFSRAEYRDDV